MATNLIRKQVTNLVERQITPVRRRYLSRAYAPFVAAAYSYNNDTKKDSALRLIYAVDETGKTQRLSRARRRRIVSTAMNNYQQCVQQNNSAPACAQTAYLSSVLTAAGR